MKKILFLIIIFNICYFNSCDILRTSSFEVISWTPGEGYHAEPENITVSINFSHEPHASSVERSFSLTGNGNRIKGNFHWEKNKLTFFPLTPLEKNADYSLNLSADARNTEGLSMDDAFNRDFTTRAGFDHPVIISCYPSMNAEVNEPRIPILLEFSLPVPLNTLYENISFTPSMQGYWLLGNDSKLAIFTPLEPWIQNNRYEIIISSLLTDTNGMNIRNDFKSVFTTGTDNEPPYLVYANRVTKNNDYIQLTPDKGFSSAAELPVENINWEKEDKILLVFSKPVDNLSVKNYISAENCPNLVLESFPGYETEVLFKFENIPVYESRFTLRIKPGISDKARNATKEEYIFKIFFNGKYSKPPELAGIRIPMAPQNENDCEPVFIGADSLFQIIPISDANYPSSKIIGTWIEVYFAAAEGASIDIFSLMEHFRIDSSNNVITFSPGQIKTNNYTISEPHPGTDKLQRIEIAGNLMNTTNYGIINFQISSGLKDNLGNRNEKTFNIPFIK